MVKAARPDGFLRRSAGEEPDLAAGEPIAVTFFWGGREDPAELRQWDLDVHWSRLVDGAGWWILQTFLRLREAGYPVEISREVPDSGLLIYHAEHTKALRAQGRRILRPTLIAVRGDLRSALLADFQIHQNGRLAGRRQLTIPHWPQPSLKARDPGRGDKIERVAFKGFSENLHPDFKSAAWTDQLQALHLEWVVDARRSGYQMQDVFTAWADFTEVDLFLAVRPPKHYLWKSKPASKLVNCWLAGVPALLGPEFAYRELRSSELDYLEISTAEEARSAIQRLIDHPALYRAMIENGFKRAEEFMNDKIIQRWASLLYEEVPTTLRNERAPNALTTVARLARLVSWHPDIADIATYCHPSVLAQRVRDRLSRGAARIASWLEAD